MKRRLAQLVVLALAFTGLPLAAPAAPASAELLCGEVTVAGTTHWGVSCGTQCDHVELMDFYTTDGAYKVYVCLDE